MADNVLNQLTNDVVPERPREFNQPVHQRLNPLLVTLHLTEFVFQVLPYAFGHFGQAMLGACRFSLTGEFRKEGEDHAK